MALHHTLPIYKAAKQLLRLTLDLPKHMRKDAKFLIGRELLRESLAIMRLIRRANMAQGPAKVPYIDDILEKVQFIEDLVGACDDTHLVSKQQYAGVIEHTQSVGKQANGWKRTYV